MSDSLRSRFSNQPGQPNNQNKPERKGRSVITTLGQLLLLAFTIFCGCLSLYWLVSDVSGQYMGNNPDLGAINISLIRKATTFSGQITIAGEPMRTLTQGQSHGSELSLLFQLPKGGAAPVHLKGQVKDGTLSGVLERGSASTKISLRRDSLASLFLQIQEHIPGWTGY